VERQDALVARHGQAAVLSDAATLDSGDLAAVDRDMVDRVDQRRCRSNATLKRRVRWNIAVPGIK
jgi:hypothetical protein